MSEDMRAELIAYLKGFDVEPIKPHEITISHYAEANHITTATANYRLDRMVEDGILYVRKAVVGGKKRNAYGRK